MQEQDKMVEIDTSGPGAEVEIPEEENKNEVEKVTEDKTYENERETKLEDNNQSDDTTEKSDKQLDVRSVEGDQDQKEKKVG